MKKENRSPNIVVYGLWHLGSVTAACLSQKFFVTGLDSDENLINNLKHGEAPISEPGLNELISKNQKNNKLFFTTDLKKSCEDADIFWVCFDTPVNDEDQADNQYVIYKIKECLPYLSNNCVVLISSQLPIGTCNALEKMKTKNKIHFAYSPENLRLGTAINAFKNQKRIVVGARSEFAQNIIKEILEKFCSNIILMNPESAEMTKHAINSFLALSITFMNEIASICEAFGADAKEVEQGLKSEPRIGEKAYLAPGTAFSGGTLARDVSTLIELGHKFSKNNSLITSIKKSNDKHRLWEVNKINEKLSLISNPQIAILGLTYKTGTDTLRRSYALQMAYYLLKKGYKLVAHDPLIKKLPEKYREIKLVNSIEQALNNSDALVICTAWDDLQIQNWHSLLKKMKNKYIFDGNGYLKNIISQIESNKYFIIGKES